jgi:hypothetical protein
LACFVSDTRGFLRRRSCGFDSGPIGSFRIGSVAAPPPPRSITTTTANAQSRPTNHRRHGGGGGGCCCWGRGDDGRGDFVAVRAGERMVWPFL